jgi:hypothetical protein
MFDGVKKMFGGGLDISAMLGPMLPGIIKDAAPKMVEAFDQKVLELENSLDGHLTNENGWIDEIVPFISKRNGQLQIDWVILTHTDDGDGCWTVEIDETLETITMQEFFSAAMAGLTNAPAPVKQLPAAPEQLHAISETVKKAPVNPDVFDELPDVQMRHNRYKHEVFVVVTMDNKFLVIEGPAPAEDVVWYGHQDEAIAQNWADAKNRELKGQ